MRRGRNHGAGFRFRRFQRFVPPRAKIATAIASPGIKGLVPLANQCSHFLVIARCDERAEAFIVDRNATGDSARTALSAVMTGTSRAVMEILKLAHEQALIARRYARYYDQHEDELPPEEFPEAANLPNVITLAEAASGSSGPRILHSLVMLETYGGGISLHRSKWGLGNTVLKTVATPAQFEKWKNHTIAIAITEPGAGSDPANIRTTATFDRETGEWILNGEKIFIS